jgi:hypothetical protein
VFWNDAVGLIILQFLDFGMCVSDCALNACQISCMVIDVRHDGLRDRRDGVERASLVQRRWDGVRVSTSWSFVEMRGRGGHR